MHILICDDRQSEIDAFVQILALINPAWEAVSFTDAEKAFAYFQSGAAIDLCFLDIIMPSGSGIDLAAKLRGEGYGGKIIFFTTSNEYAAESYALDAFYYLLKPLETEAVRAVFEKIEKADGKERSDGILVKTSQASRFLFFDTISHVEAMRNRVYFRFVNGEEIGIYATFASISQQLLGDNRFVQCHRSYIVNLNDIHAIGKNELTLRSGAKIPNSHSFPEVEKRFARWMIGGR
jgi:DNA-binding LytR/AlgR family response regulator